MAIHAKGRPSGTPCRPDTLLCVMLLLLPLATTAVCSRPDNSSPEDTDRVDVLLKAVDSGTIAYKLTDPNAVVALLGLPRTRQERDGGGMLSLDLSYPEIGLAFAKGKQDKNACYTLRGLTVRGGNVDIGGILQGERQVVVRNIEDLRRLELENVDLSNLDLSRAGDFLRRKDFDSLTQWPDPGKLPAGFDPRGLLERGKNPGLGIRALHQEGITGKGVGIAILDQPLRLGHEEYTQCLVRYDATKARGFSPQFHGSPLMGVAVGRTCGVAPEAFVYYCAAPTSAEHQMQADYMKDILAYNKTAEASGRIRVICICASPEDAPHNEAFRSVQRDAQDTGILVVTCSQQFLLCGTLTLRDGRDPDKPESYRRGGYADRDDLLLVPTGNKTVASYQGNNVYVYTREGGKSWAAPYLTGLAALAFQVNPDLSPRTIVEQLVQTATHTEAGPVVNPRAFIASIRLK